MWLFSTKKILLLIALMVIMYATSYISFSFNSEHYRQIQTQYEKLLEHTRNASITHQTSQLVTRKGCVSFIEELKGSSKGPFGIPKIIHQVYMSTRLPPQYMKFITKCRELNKDFVYVLWTDDDFMLFLRTKRPKWVPIFKR